MMKQGEEIRSTLENLIGAFSSRVLPLRTTLVRWWPHESGVHVSEKVDPVFQSKVVGLESEILDFECLQSTPQGQR